MAAAEVAVALATDRLSEQEAGLKERERQLLEREATLQATRVSGAGRCTKTFQGGALGLP